MRRFTVPTPSNAQTPPTRLIPPALRLGLALALALLVALPFAAAAAKPEDAGKGKGKPAAAPAAPATGAATQPETQPATEPAAEAPAKPATLPAGGSITDGERQAIFQYYANHEKELQKLKPLPPGIAKNLQRGKPLPPGIAKTRLPAEVLVRQPKRPAGEEIVLCGRDAVLLDKGGVVQDRITDVTSWTREQERRKSGGQPR